MFVGDGSDEQTSIDGSTTPCPPGEGWFEVLLTIPDLDDWFLISPQHYGDIPSDGQFLQWDDTLNHSVWNDVAASGGASYQTTNAAVTAAPGATTSDKINSALGAPALVEGDTAIVSGVSGDPYQGLYIYSGSVWNFAALFASPNASNVSFDNTGTTLAATEVQAALGELDSDVVTAQTIADAAQVDATQALADAAAAQATADAALPLTGGTMTGTVTFAPGQTIPISGIPDASTVDKGIVQIGTNIQVSSGVISVDSATTSVPGIVQLNDTTSSTSIVEALTANQGYSLQQQIDALVIANNLTLGGTIDGATGLLITTTPAGSQYLVAGLALPFATPANADIFVIVTVGGTMTPPGGAATLVHIGDWWLSDGSSWVLLDVGYQYPYATTTQAGVIQLATNSEVQDGLETTHAVVPSSLQSKLSDSVTLVSTTTIASSTAAKTAYDAAVAAQTTADLALPAAGGTMTGNITFQDAGEGVVFNGGSFIRGISDATGNTNNDVAASSTAVKDAYTLADSANTTANSALPKAGGTMSGAIVFAAGQTFPITGIDIATSAQLGVVQIGANVNVASGVISVATAGASALGVIYGSTTTNTDPYIYNVALGYGANGTLTTGVGNVAIGGASGDITSGSYNVALGFDVSVANPAGDKQLAIGPDAYTRWLTGDSSMNIKPGAGVYDATGSLGTSGQILTSTGTAIQWSTAPADGVVGVTGTLPIVVVNTDPANPVVSIDAASTTASGAVQLDDTVTSTSTTEAATANAAKTAYDAAVAAQATADAAIPESVVVAKGDILVGTATSVADVLSLGTDGYILTANSSTPTGLEWSAAAPDGVIGVTGTSPVTVDNTDPANPVVGIDTTSTTQLGAVQLATDAETQSGTNSTAAVTPSALQSKLSDSTSLNDSLSIASSAAVSAAYTLANNALPLSGGTMTGQITLVAAQTISGGTF